MKPRNTLIVVAVLALLLAYLYWVELPLTPEQVSTRQGTPTTTPAAYALRLDPNQVQTFIITDLRLPRTVSVTRTDGGWRVTQPLSAPADQTKCDSTASALANLQVTRVLTMTDPAAFGFAPAELEGRLIMKDGTAYGILLGNKTPDGTAYYAAFTGDKSKVFLIDLLLPNSLHSILEVPPIAPPTATPTANASATPMLEATPVPPGFVPTLLPTPVATPKP